VFATGVNKTGGQFAIVFNCAYLCGFSKKIEMTLNRIVAVGKMIHEKKPEVKNIMTLSFQVLSLEN
jgi:hypothetical protein